MTEIEKKHLCPETGRTFATPEEAQASAARFREIQAECDAGGVPELRIGDVVYVDTSLYLGDGVDDFRGGLAEVSEFRFHTSASRSIPFVKVVQLMDTWHNWEMLARDQRKYRAEFGTSWSHPDPDYRPEFNEW